MKLLLTYLPMFVRAWWVELLCALLIVLVVPLIAGYIVLAEHRVPADEQARSGPAGMLQAFPGALKLLLKEDVLPDGGDWFIFWFAPMLAASAAITAMGAIAFGPWFQVGRDINIGLLFAVGVSALAPLGIVLGRWESVNHYSMIAVMRSTAQFISHESAAGFALVSGLLLAGTLKVSAIVEQQFVEHVWFVFLAPVGFFVYFVASIVGIERAHLELHEMSLEPADGEVPEYSGFRGSLYLMTEYASKIVVASVGTTLFLGGWLRPFPNVHWLAWLDALPVLLLAALGAHWVRRAGNSAAQAQTGQMWVVAVGCFAVALIFALSAPLFWAPLRILHVGLYGAFWFLLKVATYIYILTWLRFTLPRFRFDQLMRLGWHILIPLALLNVIAVGIALALQSGLGLNRWLATLLSTAVILIVAVLLVRWNGRYAAADSTGFAGDHPPVEDSIGG